MYENGYKKIEYQINVPLGYTNWNTTYILTASLILIIVFSLTYK